MKGSVLARISGSGTKEPSASISRKVGLFFGAFEAQRVSCVPSSCSRSR